MISFQELSQKNTLYLQAKNKEGFFALELTPRALEGRLKFALFNTLNCGQFFRYDIEV
jgi:hypothetical protein